MNTQQKLKDLEAKLLSMFARAADGSQEQKDTAEALKIVRDLLYSGNSSPVGIVNVIR